MLAVATFTALSAAFSAFVRPNLARFSAARLFLSARAFCLRALLRLIGVVKP